ncbi:MAG: hypothetical protein F4213_11795 [Boseongicola sp. SB0677_bin_26]|nr:hypothetical protein [Boseongicola sp. SB0665_bin_10]MYG26688.1 hypothetical protein [Boseongicola sp. SB0677_bin_26]
MKRCLAGIVATIGIATSAHAVTPVPPGFLVNPVYQGRIGGLEAWASPHSEGLFLVLPEATLRGSLGTIRGGHRLVIGGSLFVDSAQALPVSAKEFQSRREIEEAFPIASEMMERLRESVEDDVARQRAAFQSALNETTRPVRRPNHVTGDLSGPGAVDGPEGGQDVSMPDRKLAGPDPEDAINASGLLEDVAENVFWFGLGDPEAPTVYAFIDPACPFCAQAIQTLGPEIARGDLQLRVALAQVVSDRSLSLIAAILAEEDVPGAFLEHEYGTRSLQPGDWNTLSAQVREGVENNATIIRAHGVPGVPFFVFRTAEGTEAFFGVPEPDQFIGALPAS